MEGYARTWRINDDTPLTGPPVIEPVICGAACRPANCNVSGKSNFARVRPRVGFKRLVNASSISSKVPSGTSRPTTLRRKYS